MSTTDTTRKSYDAVVSSAFASLAVVASESLASALSVVAVVVVVAVAAAAVVVEAVSAAGVRFGLAPKMLDPTRTCTRRIVSY